MMCNCLCCQLRIIDIICKILTRNKLKYLYASRKSDYSKQNYQKISIKSINKQNLKNLSNAQYCKFILYIHRNDKNQLVSLINQMKKTCTSLENDISNMN